MTPSPVSPASDLDLPTTLRALAGDASALARLYVGYQPLVLRIAQGMAARFPGTSAPSDLAAEVWLRMLDRRLLAAFDPARGSFRRFFRMVAWQQAFELALGSARRRQRESITPSGMLPEIACAPEAEALDHRWLLSSIMRTVSPPLAPCDDLLITAIYGDQRPLRELAARLGWSPDRVYQRHRRLRARLARAARELEGDPRHRGGARPTSRQFQTTWAKNAIEPSIERNDG